MDNLSGVLEGGGYKIKKRKSPTSHSQKMYKNFRKHSKKTGTNSNPSADNDRRSHWCSCF